MSDKNTRSTGGGGMFLLFLVFLVLKLTNVIDWSWWWVTAPLWGPVTLVFVIVLVVGILALTVSLLAKVF